MSSLANKSKQLRSVHVPGFTVLGGCQEFYQRLKTLLRHSQSACIASLFFGDTDEMADILDILEHRKSRGLATVILIDRNRGALNGCLHSIRKRGLAQMFHLVDLSTSSLLPRRLNELLRVFHTKALVFDDVAILSGANMDASYMTTRVDRYIEIHSRQLADDIRSAVFGIGPTTSTHTAAHPLPVCIGMFKQDQELSVVQALLDDFDEIHISTGYLNFPRTYLTMFSGRRISLYASCPGTHSFDSFGILGSLVGPIYSYSFHRTLDAIGTLDIHEYCKDGVSFHQKGIWGFRNGMAATIIGSSNFNRRSVERDDETSYLLLTSDTPHIQKLRAEVQRLRDNSEPRSLSQLRKRTYGIVVILLFMIFNRFL